MAVRSGNRNNAAKKSAAKKTPDYNKDGVVTSVDKEWAKVDKNKDGRVSDKERKAYTRPSAQRTITTIDPDTGRSVTRVEGGKQKELPSEMTAADFGINQAVLNKYPDLRPLLNKAIKQQWTEQRWMLEIEKSSFGQARLASQQAFDIGIEGPQSEEWQKQIDDASAQLRQTATSMGISLNDAQINDFARRYVRDGLTDFDTASFLSSMYQPSETPTGNVGDMVAQLKRMAASYGLPVDNDYLNSTVQQAIAQGQDWQSWIANQENSFRQKAKVYYSGVADLLDTQTVEDILDPFMNDAAQLLGVSRSAMSTTDPKWTAALQGEQGVLNRDQWITKIKTDKKYGWDQTANARREYMSLVDDIAAVFNKA